MSDLSDKELDISKMKVPDLKRELKNRGLSTEGKKNDLVERLQTAIGDSALLDDGLGDHDDILDEDVLSDDESEDLIKGELDKKPTEPESKPIEDLKRKSTDTPGDGKTPKKIVLNRNVLSVSDDMTTKIAEKEVETESKENGSTVESKPVAANVSSLSSKERLEKRAAKFGVPMSLDAKKEARAARFGLPTADSKVGGLVSTNVDVLKKRAERFGGTLPESNLSKAEWEEKKQKREERFGKTEVDAQKDKKDNITTRPKITTQQGANSDKLKLRAQRFQIKS